MPTLSYSLTDPIGAQEGFTPLPRRTLDFLLCLDLTKRELSVLLLVARLTYGCRGRLWIALRQADLQVVGIGANHARDCLENLLKRGLLVQHGSQPAYRLGEFIVQEKTTKRLERLELLVVRQLLNPSSKGNPVTKGKADLPSRGSRPFHNEEPHSSRNGKELAQSGWQFDRSTSQFVKNFRAGIYNKDKERQ